MSEIRRPSVRSSGAYPRSIEIPRACSSGRRSVSFPVSARTSHVLPWSMWPAVPTVSGMARPNSGSRAARSRTATHGGDRRRDLERLVVGERAAVEQRPAVADDGDYRGLAVAQGRRELL